MRLRRAAAARWLFLYVHTACVTCRMYSRRQNDRKTIYFFSSLRRKYFFRVYSRVS